MSLELGSTIERYTVEAELGRGGMATVYRVKHAVLGTYHALKVVHSSGALENAELVHEGRLQAHLDPEWIVPVHDVLTVNGTAALLMPLVDGCSLRQVLQTHRPTESETAAILIAVANGIAVAHDKGIVHRDLKPPNVLIDIHRGRVRIRVADFGLGASFETTEAHRRFAGTPAYAPPEQINGPHRSHPTQDLWALGVLAVECLTGSLPFSGSSLEDIRASQDAGPPNLEAVPTQWRPLVTQLLQSDPALRGPQASDIPNAIRTLIQPDPLLQDGPMGAAVHQLRQHVAPHDLNAHLHTPIHSAGSEDTFAIIEDVPTEDRPSNNLPVFRDVFVGRETELQVLQTQLRHRTGLFTLLGMGGTGKTRLAVEYARGAVQDWSGGVCFCDLSDARTTDGVLSAFARALEIPLGKLDAVERIGNALIGRGELLFIIDNVEQVIEPITPLLRHWFERAPEGVFIATSRTVIGVPGERTWVVPPLSSDASVALFIARAQRADPNFDPAPHDIPILTTLVDRLDCLPLPIELAAARSRMMTPQKMIERIGQRFKLLSSRGGGNDRHRTLRATLDWSWDLLTDWEQMALAQCSVFEGGFTLEAGEAILDLEAYEDAPWPMDVIQALLDKSLLRVAGDDRFTMLVSVQAYAREKLDAIGTPQETEHRHGSYYAEFGSVQAIASLRRRGGVALIHALTRELDNLMVAWSRALAAEHQSIVVSTCLAAREVLKRIGPWKTAAEMAEASLKRFGLDNEDRIRLLLAAASANHLNGDMVVSQNQYETALQAARDVDSKPLIATALGNLGLNHFQQGQIQQALSYTTESMELARSIGAKEKEGFSALTLSDINRRRGDTGAAMELARHALHLAQQLGDSIGEGEANRLLGGIHVTLREPELALQHLESALQTHREAGNPIGESSTLSAIGRIYWIQGDLQRTHTCIQQSLDIARHIGNRRQQGRLFHSLGLLHFERGQLDESHHCLEDGLNITRDMSDRHYEGIILGNLGLLYKELGDFARGRETLEEAVHIAREVQDQRLEGSLHFNRADLAYMQQDYAFADAHLEAAYAIATKRFPALVGVIWGTWAKVHVRNGRMDEAQHAIEAGEPHIRAMGEKRESAKFLAKKATVLALLGQRESATQALDEATRLHQEMGAADPHRERELQEARDALSL